MVRCSNNCIPNCDYCLFAVHELIEDEKLGGTIYGAPVQCELHPSTGYVFLFGTGYCDDFHCIDARGNNRKTRANRRHQDFHKAIRKQMINPDYYSNLHQYSKNKIHCSCPMCRAKTNDHEAKFGPKVNWPQSDKKTLEDMEEQKTAWYDSSNITDNEA